MKKKTLVTWQFIFIRKISQFYISENSVVRATRKQARQARERTISNGEKCGPIVRVELPMPREGK